MKPLDVTLRIAVVLVAGVVPFASQRPVEAVRQERIQAIREAPLLAEVLALKQGMTVADVGSKQAVSGDVREAVGPHVPSNLQRVELRPHNEVAFMGGRIR